ncbi:MAG TPA: transketolase C-terminal domain-containing protein [Candidatus Hydrogenedentes bacterium]|nr:transketolase C-terminal domain-containing protein [Candidatus Hydrogenedentota bacterium]HQE81677.1 transketolase C-terminal domain-containing protein [Candidatus Hydrogenedentota bacterium]HQH70056.1 transketolase C-terminal domain-containing protein [Candidatus Hydrogenedentota bacterium]HQM48472.1 transketolase C-terminal domain-containing protein [Candidatus Hydrogenedentota bacterium]
MSTTEGGLTWTVYDADKLTQREIYGLVLSELGEKHPEIVGLSADLAKSTKIGMFGDKFPDRFFNFGIAEQNLFGVAAGMAKAGLVPFVSTFSVFASMRACEFLRTDICYQNLNVKVIATHGGTSFGSAGTTHHSTEDLSIVRAFANLRVVVPADGIETARTVRACMEIEGPVYIRIGRGFEPRVYESEDYEFQIGKAVEMRPGTDITVIGCGPTVYHAVQAAKILEEQQGLGVRVLNMHTIKPIDEEAILKAVAETRRIVTFEDHNVIGGLGTAVADVIAASGKGCAFEKVGIPDVFSIHGYPEDLMNYYKIDTDGILEKVGEVMGRDFEEDEDWEDEV